MAKGFRDFSVLDLSSEALKVARSRLGDAGALVKWIAADATLWEPPKVYDVWHDRAAFHFVNGQQQRRTYIESMVRALDIGGHVIIGTSALDGPERCSSLTVNRHSAESLSALFGEGFFLLDSRRHEHATPWGSVQALHFSTFKRIA